MLLRVEAAGCDRTWWFPGTTHATAWIAGVPWRADGGLLNLALPNARGAERVVDALRTAIRVADGTTGDALLIPEQEVAPGESMLATLLRAMGHEPGPSRTAGLRSIRDALADAGPHVFVVRAFERTWTRDLSDETRALREELAKSVPPTPLAVVVLRDGDTVDPVRDADFRRGLPEGAVVGWGEPRTRVWPRYLHSRLAWECAGEPATVCEWSDRWFSSVAVGRDDLVESGLNAAADEEVRARGVDVAAACSEFETLLRSGVRRAHGAGGPTSLVSWTPPVSMRTMPTPWFARSALRTCAGLSDQLATLYQYALVCVPLVSEILGRCLHHEFRERAACRAKPPQLPVPCEAEDLWRRFQERESTSDIAHFPADCPARPRDAWSFTEFGSFLRAFEPGTPSSARARLRQLRNAMAHGRYASWTAVDRLLDLEGSLGV